MDVDEDIDSDDDVDRMNVDGEEMPMQKRTKSETGDVVLHSRAPRKNRQLTGLRDDQVRFPLLFTPFPRLTLLVTTASCKSTKTAQFGAA